MPVVARLCGFKSRFLHSILEIALLHSNVQEWRNWQTRRLQVPVVARLCGFKSRFLHSFFILLRKITDKKWMQRFGVCIHFVLCVFFLPKDDPSAGKVIQKNHQKIGKNLHPEIRQMPGLHSHPHPAQIKKTGQKTAAKERRHFSSQNLPPKRTAVKHKPFIRHKSKENGQNPGCRRGRDRPQISHPAQKAVRNNIYQCGTHAKKEIGDQMFHPAICLHLISLPAFQKSVRPKSKCFPEIRTDPPD